MSILFFFVVALFCGTVLFFILFIISVSRGAPYATVDKEHIETMLGFVNLRPGECVADLGSGDGRIVMAFAVKNIEAHGFEINPFLVLWSRYKIKKSGLETKAFIHWKNLWNVDYSSFNIVTIYGARHIMHALEEKLLHELRPGTQIVSKGFRLPNAQAKKEENNVYYYIC